MISEFRANQGKVGGQMANIPLLLLTMTGAKSGRAITKPLAYTRDGDRIVVIARRGASDLSTEAAWEQLSTLASKAAR